MMCEASDINVTHHRYHDNTDKCFPKEVHVWLHIYSQWTNKRHTDWSLISVDLSSHVCVCQIYLKLLSLRLKQMSERRCRSSRPPPDITCSARRCHITPRTAGTTVTPVWSVFRAVRAVCISLRVWMRLMKVHTGVNLQKEIITETSAHMSSGWTHHQHLLSTPWFYHVYYFCLLTRCHRRIKACHTSTDYCIHTNNTKRNKYTRASKNTCVQ